MQRAFLTLLILGLAGWIPGMAADAPSSSKKLPEKIRQTLGMVQGTQTVGMGCWISEKVFLTGMDTFVQAGKEVKIRGPGGETYWVISVLAASPVKDNLVLLKLHPVQTKGTLSPIQPGDGANGFSVSISKMGEWYDEKAVKISHAGPQYLDLGGSVDRRNPGGFLVNPEGQLLGFKLPPPERQLTVKKDGTQWRMAFVSEAKNAANQAVGGGYIQELLRMGERQKTLTVAEVAEKYGREKSGPLLMALDEYVQGRVVPLLGAKVEYEHQYKRTPGMTVTTITSEHAKVEPKKETKETEGKLLEDKMKIKGGDLELLKSAGTVGRDLKTVLSEVEFQNDGSPVIKSARAQLLYIAENLPLFSNEYLNLKGLGWLEFQGRMARLEEQRAALQTAYRQYLTQISPFKKSTP